MKTIEVQYTRKITFNKIITVTDKVAKEALKLDGKDVEQPRSIVDNKQGFYLLTETLIDETQDMYDGDSELENVCVTIFEPKKKK